MSTTTDDLIGLKDEAVELAYLLAAIDPESGEAPAHLIEQAKGVVQHAEEYDEAEADEDVVSLEEWQEKQS